MCTYMCAYVHKDWESVLVYECVCTEGSRVDICVRMHVWVRICVSFMWGCVCTHLCIWGCTCVSLCVGGCVHTCVYVWAYLCECMCECMYRRVKQGECRHTGRCLCVHTWVCVWGCSLMRMHVRTCEGACTCVRKKGTDGWERREHCDHDQMGSLFRETSSVLSTRRFPALRTDLF